MRQKRLDKEICEKPRRRDYDGTGATRSSANEEYSYLLEAQELLDLAEAPSPGPTKKGAVRVVAESGTYDTRNFSDHFAPLQGWLAKQVGRPWDKVYSELKQKLPSNSLHAQHVLSHVEDFVAVKTFLGNDGAVWRTDRWGQPKPLIDQYIKEGLYVDPTTKILQRWVRPKQQPVKPTNVEFIAASSTMLTGTYNGVLYRNNYCWPAAAYERINGTWFYREYEYMPGFPATSRVSYKPIVVKTSRTMSKAELKQFYKNHPAAARV